MHLEEEGGFRLLWPVLLLERSLPGHERADDELERLVLGLEAQNENLTTDYRDANLFAQRNPAVEWLRQCVHKTAVDYCRRAGMDYAVDWTLQGWANVNRLGDYHDPHNHPHAYLSGTYYVRVPASRAPCAATPRSIPSTPCCRARGPSSCGRRSCCTSCTRTFRRSRASASAST